MEDDDTLTSGGEALSVSEAAAAYAKATAPEAIEGQSEPEVEDESETTDDEIQASEEDAGEDEDGEPEADEGQAEDEEGEEPDTEGGRYVGHNGRVKLPDGSESTVADLIQGNLRDRDYRQKTMEAAEVRKAAEAKVAATTQLETQLSEQRDQLVTLLKKIVPDAPDPSLATTDPYAYTQQRAQHEAWVAEIQRLEQQSQQAKQQKDEESAKARREKGNAELATLVQKVPALKDEKRFSAFIKDAAEHGAQYGFSVDELREAIGYDHRMAMALRDAIQWRKLQASKANVAKKVENRPPVQKGGKRLNPSEHRARSASDAVTRLKQSGSVEDAAAAYIASLNKG